MMEGIQVLLVVIASLVVIMSILHFADNKTINFYVQYIYYGSAMLATCCVSFPYSLLRPRSLDNALRASRIFVAILQQPVFKIRWNVRNLHVIETDQAAVVVANHQSIIDVMAMAHIWPNMKKCTAVMKKELLFYPMIGISTWLWGMIFVDRKNPREAVRIFQAATDLVVSKKAKLWFFPEGRRGDGKNLLPFKKAAFQTAIQIQTPIIPIVISPYYFIDFAQKTFEGEGYMKMTILEEIPTAGLTEKDVEPLMEKTYKLMKTEFNKLSTAVKSERQEYSK